MLYIPPWLEMMREEAVAGVKEIYGPEHNPRIIEYGKAVDLIVTTDEIPWCSDIMNWVFWKLEMPRTRSAAARSWLEYGIRLKYAALGAICIFKRGGGNQPGRDVIAAPGHVGLLIDMPEPKKVTILAGNQGNRVCEDVFPLSRLLDMRWPG